MSVSNEKDFCLRPGHSNKLDIKPTQEYKNARKSILPWSLIKEFTTSDQVLPPEVIPGFKCSLILTWFSFKLEVMPLNTAQLAAGLERVLHLKMDLFSTAWNCRIFFQKTVATQTALFPENGRKFSRNCKPFALICFKSGVSLISVWMFDKESKTSALADSACVSGRKDVTSATLTCRALSAEGYLNIFIPVINYIS